MQLTRGPQVHGFRPAIDPLFASTARGFGPRAVGVILSGTLSDGAAGLLAIKTAGGVAIVQDPEEAAFSGMPLKALEVVDADFILPVSEIAQTLVNLSGEPVGLMKGSERLSGESETDIIRKDMHNFEQGKRPASTTVLTCPECGGVLFELFDGLISKFRCHVGHEYSSDSLLSEQAHALESALWSAIRALEERASLLERMSILSGNNNNRRTAERFKERSHEAERNADLLRQVLMKGIGAGQEVNDAPEYGD
ncbi:MAG: chemotaxis protein CheB [Chloroflexota bacterium]|nr:MAG: chemotaxis protein CheB [Chloroflexota bacterium]